MKAPVIAGPEPVPNQGIEDTVPGDASTTATLTIGTSVNGAVNTMSDRDWFAVDLVAGKRYSISLDGVVYGSYGALSDPYLRLRDASGNVVKLDDDGGQG